jgi:hypothetical protein
MNELPQAEHKSDKARAKMRYVAVFLASLKMRKVTIVNKDPSRFSVDER